MWLKAFRRVPWWVWPGWLLHLGSYGLPAYENGRGYECAREALDCWVGARTNFEQLKQGEWLWVAIRLTLGWFSVTNLAALAAPFLLAATRLGMAAWWLGLLELMGVALAVFFISGGLTGESEWRPLQIGGYLWFFSYAWLAVAGFAVARRRRLASTHGAASADSDATSARGPG